MNREDALKSAIAFVTELGAVPLNGRGYPSGDAKVPTLAEKIKAILDLAEFMTGGDDPDPITPAQLAATAGIRVVNAGMPPRPADPPVPGGGPDRPQTPEPPF
jgi:hypothetical protein